MFRTNRNLTEQGIDALFATIEAEAKASAAEFKIDTWWPALAGRLQGHYRLLARDYARTLEQLQPEAASHSQITYEWFSGLGEPVTCILDYDKGQRGVREDGVQMEPDLDAEATLCSAWLRGVDILPLLSQEQVDEIETSALARALEAA